MFKKPGVYVNTVLSLVALAFFINAFSLPGHTYVRNALAAIASITGEGTVNYLPRFVGASSTSYTLGDSIIFDDSAGRIGINTIAPTNLFTANQTGNTTAATATTYGLAVNIAGSQYVTLGADTNYAYLQSWNAKPLYINSQGNNTIFGASVGIGTTSPSQLLHLVGLNPMIKIDDTGYAGFGAVMGSTGGASSIWFNQAAPSNTNYSFQAGSATRFNSAAGNMNFRIANASKMTILTSGGIAIGSTYAVTPSDPGANSMIIEGSVGIGTTSPGGKLVVKGAGTTTGIGFQTQNSSGTALVTMLDTGNVGIGTTSPTAKLQVSGGDIYVGQNVRVGTELTGGASPSQNGCIQWGSGVAMIGDCSSDLRLKKDIVPLSPALAKIMQLNPVTFRMRSDEFPNKFTGDDRYYGLIAQDVEKVFPDLVSEDKEGYKTLKYGIEFQMLSIKAIQEQQAQIEELKKEIEILKNKSQ